MWTQNEELQSGRTISCPSIVGNLVCRQKYANRATDLYVVSKSSATGWNQGHWRLHKMLQQNDSQEIIIKTVKLRKNSVHFSFSSCWTTLYEWRQTNDMRVYLMRFKSTIMANSFSLVSCIARGRWNCKCFVDIQGAIMPLFIFLDNLPPT